MKAERPEDNSTFWKSWATKNALNYYTRLVTFMSPRGLSPQRC